MAGSLENTYQGSCHCQAVKFTCQFKLTQPTMCNCSYCSKRNAVLHIIDDIDVYQGEKALTCYQFNKKKGAHYFCRHCSIFIYSTPPEPIYPFAISLCTLDNIDWAHKDLFYFDGKSL